MGMTAGTVTVDAAGEPSGGAGSMARAIFDAMVALQSIDTDDGTHTGGDAEATLTDGTKTWTADELKNLFVINLADLSSGQITANTGTQITATLAGGTHNSWYTGDDYVVFPADMAGRAAARQGIADLCNGLASGIVSHIVANAKATVTPGDAGLQLLPAAPMNEDDPCKAPAATKYLDIE